MKNIYFGLIGLVIVLALVVVVAARFYQTSPAPITSPPDTTISSPPQIDTVTPEPGIGQANPTTLIGEYVCLPHKDTSGAQTMECAFGLQTHPDIFYGLDMSRLNNDPTLMQFETGKKLQVTGVLNTETAKTSNYNIKGTIQVEKIEHAQ